MNLDELALKVAKECLDDRTANQLPTRTFMATDDELIEYTERLVAELAKQEPVAKVTAEGAAALLKLGVPSIGTKLYAAPVIPAGMVLVKDDPIAYAAKGYQQGDAVSFFTRDDIPKGTHIYAATPKGEGK